MAFSGSPAVYFQFSVQHMWRISTHLHTEIISVQRRDGKTEGTTSASYSEHTEKKKEQKVNLLFTCHSNQLTFFSSVLQQWEVASLC